MYFYNFDYNPTKQMDMRKFVPFLNDSYDMIQSYMVHKIKSLPFAGKYVVQNEVKNPPLLAYRIYGDTQYWWILLLYNDVITLDELYIGRVLKFPNVSDIMSIIFNIRSYQQYYGDVVK